MKGHFRAFCRLRIPESFSSCLTIVELTLNWQLHKVTPLSRSCPIMSPMYFGVFKVGDVMLGLIRCAGNRLAFQGFFDENAITIQA